MSKLFQRFPVHSFADALELASEIPTSMYVGQETGYGAPADGTRVIAALRRAHPGYAWSVFMDRTGERSKWGISPLELDPRDVTSPRYRLPRMPFLLRALDADHAAGRPTPTPKTLKVFFQSPWWWVKDDGYLHCDAHEFLLQARLLLAERPWVGLDPTSLSCPRGAACRRKPTL